MTVEEYQILAKFTFDWIKNEKRITKEYVKLFLSRLSKINHLESFLKTISFSCKNRYEYDPIKETLFFSLKDLLENFVEIGLMYKWSPFERDCALYFYVNEYLLHEIEHIKDFKNCYGKEENLKVRISRICYDTEIGYKKAKTTLEKQIWLVKDKQKEKKYQKNYNYCPLERFANVNSLHTMIKMAEFLKLEELNYYYLYKLYEQLIEIYEKIENPTAYYLSQMGYQEEALKIQKEIPNLSFEERLELGLEISKKEQNELKRRIYKKIPWFKQ